MYLSNKTLEDILSVAKEYLNEDSIKLICKSYEKAKAMHEGQFRNSGEPYIQHPLEVGYILATLHTGPNTICAGLMHDVLEDTSYSKEQMISEFGEEIAELVDGVTKISKLKYMTKDKALAHNHEKLFIAMAKDIRVIIIKLVDRLHNMRTIEYQPYEKQVRIAQESLNLYSPLAHRMGMYRIKAEIEDLSFKVLQPETYKEIENAVKLRQSEREADLIFMEDKLKDILNEHGITHYELKGRVKNIYSIHNKMVTKNKSIDEIFDLLALRIIVDDIANCYATLGFIHNMWTPIPRRFKDYIAMPKPNLYQSLHTTVIGPNGKIYEVQIRTFEMDSVAELGVAAHWAYKENSNYSASQEQLDVAQKLKWYKDLATYVENSDDDPVADIKEDIFQANVYVFTPNGDVYELPQGSMPLDFAYRIHSEVGNKCVGAIVNGKIVPLSYQLKLGDVVEIKTSKQSSGPSESWMKLAKTSHAKGKIRTYLNKIQRDELVEKGKVELEKQFKNLDYDVNQITDKMCSDTFSKLKVKTYEDLCCEVGKNTISALTAINRLLGLTDIKLDDEYALKQYSEETSETRTRKHAKNDFGIIVEGLEKAQIKLGNCCQPVYGDKIFGYVTKGYGIVVHRLGCPNLIKQSERNIAVSWDGAGNNQRVFNSTVKILSRDRKNLVADMINVVNSQNVTIVSVTSAKNINEETQTKFKLQVSSIDDLDKVILGLQNMPETYSVERMFK